MRDNPYLLEGPMMISFSGGRTSGLMLKRVIEAQDNRRRDQGAFVSKALVLFSGGQDSTVCLAWALRRYEEVYTVGFDYGQRHGIEMQCRAEILKHFPTVVDHVLKLGFLRDVSDSALTSDAEIKFAADGVPTTFVPARNLAFLTAAAPLGYRLGAYDLIGGMCETDYSGYADCRRNTLDAMQLALSLGMERHFQIVTPLMWTDKAGTWEMGYRLGVLEIVRELSHTCYTGYRTMHDWGAGCGTCPACVLRARGYEKWRKARGDAVLLRNPSAE